MASIINEVFTAFKSGVAELAKSTVKVFVSEAESDADAFLNQSRDQLSDLTTAFARGKLSKDEFKDLVDDQIVISEMFALTKVGIAKTRIDRFRVGLIDLFISSVFKAVGV